MAALDAGPTQIALCLLVDGDVAAGGPDAFAAQFPGSPERITIAGAAVADGVQTTGPPLAVGRVHQALPVSPTDQFFGLIPGQRASMAPVEGLQGAVVQPETGLDGPVAVLAQSPAVAGLDDEVGGGIDHLLHLAQEQDRIVGQRILSLQALHLAPDVGPVFGDELVQETAIDHPAVLSRDVVPILILGKMVEAMIESPSRVQWGLRLDRSVHDAPGVGALQKLRSLPDRGPQQRRNLVRVERPVPHGDDQSHLLRVNHHLQVGTGLFPDVKNGHESIHQAHHHTLSNPWPPIPACSR